MGFALGGATVAAGSIGAMTSAGKVALTLVEYGSYVVIFVSWFELGVDIKRNLSRRIKLAVYLTDIYNREMHQSQTEKSQVNMSEIVMHFLTPWFFHKKFRIPGIPKDHFLQEVFELFKDDAKYGFPLLNMETANTSAQDSAQIAIDMNGIRSSPSDKMLGLVCNGMQSEVLYCETAAELTGNRDSICMSHCGDTAIINVQMQL